MQTLDAIHLDGLHLPGGSGHHRASSGRWTTRLAIAWAVVVAASVLGLLASYWWDLPSGPAIVCSLGGFLVLFAAARRWLPG